MKILVLSDSHSALSFMRRCIESVKPDVVIHLGDHFDDGEAMKETFQRIPFFLLPGNCDRYRCSPWQPEILIEKIGGVYFYMTHGHRHGVKAGLGKLLSDARASKANVVLYGHTHQAYCCREDSLWILNPGSCGHYGGSAGMIEISNGVVDSCKILSDCDI